MCTFSSKMNICKLTYSPPQENFGDTQYIVWSASSGKGLFAPVGGIKIKCPIWLASEEKIKRCSKVSFLSCKLTLPYDLSTFLIKISLFFLHIGGKNKKN